MEMLSGEQGVGRVGSQVPHFSPTVSGFGLSRGRGLWDLGARLCPVLQALFSFREWFRMEHPGSVLDVTDCEHVNKRQQETGRWEVSSGH